MKRHTPIRDPKFKIQTKVFCILGDERAFVSKSPAIFSAVFKRVGLNAVYVPFMVQPDNIVEAVKSLRVLNIVGANVTVPYKQTVLPYLDVLSEGAMMIGAINMIARDGETLKGYNTNAIGFMDALRVAGFDVAGKSALVFGCGGAARAVVFILNWLRADTVWVAGRNVVKAGELSRKLGGKVVGLSDIWNQTTRANIVVNATSVSSPEEDPELAERVSRLQIEDCDLLMDLNYGRKPNFWQQVADARGIRFTDGLSTLAHQASRSFALWTGVRVSAQAFLDAMNS